MVNTKITLKLNKILEIKQYLTKKIKKDYAIKPIELDREALIEEKEKLEKAKESLNITNEMRNKNVKELTSKEKDALYDEYVYNSAIEGLNDFIEGNYYTHEQFLEEMKKIEEECVE